MPIHGAKDRVIEGLVRRRTLIASGSRSASSTSSAISNADYRGVRLFLDYTANTTAGPTQVAMRLRGRDPVSSNWVDVAGARSTTASSTSTIMLTVYPGIGETANVSVSDFLPGMWDVVVEDTSTAGGTVTYSVGAELLQ